MDWPGLPLRPQRNFSNQERLSMTARTTVHRLHVAQDLHAFIDNEVLPAVGIKSASFWKGFNAIVADLAPRNLALLAERDRLQHALDDWHRAYPGPIATPAAMKAYQKFLHQ